MSKIIAIDPGHGGTDPGATGNGLQEKDLTLKIAKLVRSRLNTLYTGAEARLTRDDDTTTRLASRTGMANSWNSACLVSIHINSFRDSSANGFESFVYTTDGPGTKSAALQDKLHPRLAKLWKDKGRADRGQKRANFHMVREFKGASVLVELGFIVSPEDARLLKSNKFLQQNADAIADGIADHLRLSEARPPVGKSVHRVIVDGNQEGAYGESENVERAVGRAIGKGAKKIEIERV